MAKFRAMRKLWARVEDGLRACAEAGAGRGRDRLAHDGAARSSREHAAHHDRGRRRRPRRRRRITVLPHTAALGLPDRVRPPRSRATPSLCCWKNQTSPASPIRPPAPARIEDHDRSSSATRPGRCSRRSKAPAAPRRRWNAGSIQHKVAAVRASAQAAVARRDRHSDRHERYFPTCAKLRRYRCFQSRRARRCTPTIRAASPSRRCRASGSPNRSSGCAMLPMRSSPRPARGRQIFLANARARQPISPRARASPRTSSRPAVSKRWQLRARISRPSAAFKASGAALACLCGVRQSLRQSGR